MKKQLNYTEEVLFNNYMISSLGEEYVHSQIPFYFDKETYKNMIFYSQEINRISLDILNNINEKHKEVLNYFDDFPFKDKIFNLKCPISPMFWTRYDTFRDNYDNIYFAEFNYDKPCGQKEIHLAGKSEFEGNLNINFRDNLIKELLNICNNYSNSENKINVGFLMDPCHYEELHHSYYFKDILKDTNINIIQVGPNNLSIKEGDIYAYSTIKLPIILRLFPTEFFYEISNIDEILDCFNEERVLIINDPRIIAIQSKGFFAYLWSLVKNDSPLISSSDKSIISKCIPYTEILTEYMQEDIFKNKDKYVIKSSLGRYSQEVYIGKLYSQDDWESEMKCVYTSNKIHIRQDLIKINQEYTYSPYFDNMNIPRLAFGNFGIYIIDHKVEGFLVRWSKDFMTDDNYTWMCPLGVKDFPICIKQFTNKLRKEIWDDILEEVMFKYYFTGAYTNIYEYVSLDLLLVKKELYEEMLFVSSNFCRILKMTYPYIQKNIELFGPILGIPGSLYKLVSTSCTSALCALGRIDFAIDNNGDLKILEFNSETPAGLVESIGFSPAIKEKLNVKYNDPNEELRNNIRNTLLFIIKDLSKFKDIKNIGVVTSWYYEDIYTSQLIYEILQECGDYNIIFGNIYDLKVKNKKVYLYGNEIDLIYRHYPLDWFHYEEDMQKLIEPLSSGDYLINPGHTLITQSKAFFAVLHELIGKEFLCDEDEKFILKYIPYTCLELDEKVSSDFVVKPYLSREGLGINMSYEDTTNKLEEITFQDRVNIKPFKINISSTMGNESEYKFPVVGVYITNDKPAGAYTRMGNIVTNKNANYMATYIK